jgi:3-dehydroquinate dehydratase-2
MVMAGVLKGISINRSDCSANCAQFVSAERFGHNPSNLIEPRQGTGVSRLLLLHGPNLNLLGGREPNLYGTRSLAEIENDLREQARSLGHELRCEQHNQEGLLIESIHRAKTEGVAYIIANLGAFTHTSIALRDAFLAVGIPFIEVHLSNVYAREAFRQRSYFSDIATGVIVGLGPLGYRLALTAVHERLHDKH